MVDRRHLAVVPDPMGETERAEIQADDRAALVKFLRGMADRYETTDEALTALAVVGFGPDAATAGWWVCDPRPEWDEMRDLVEMLNVAMHATRHGHDPQEAAAQTRAYRVAVRAREALKRQQYEREYPVVCPLCGKRCKTQAGLYGNHWRANHPGAPPPT